MINSVPTMILKHDMRLECLIFKILQIVELLLIATTLFKDLFDKSNVNNVNERFGFSEPHLFNFLSFIFYV